LKSGFGVWGRQEFAQKEFLMHLPTELHCLEHLQPLETEQGEKQITQESQVLICPLGCRIPVVKGIPRFVSSKNYASAFGDQWNTYRKTQLDSYTGTTISRDRLERCLGGSLDIVRGKSILEAGCGAGRFTELLLCAGAQVFACDLSTAVEANYDNCNQHPNYFVCQANLLQLPVLPEQFDIVICLGVIQHTPNPEETMTALCSYVKPGGLLVIDHYRYGAEDLTPMRRKLRSFLIQTPANFSLLFTGTLVSALWPIHQFLWEYRSRARFARLRSRFLYHSPVLDYHDSYAHLGPKLLHAWAMLDTHDALTDYYKHKRNVEEITNCLHENGLIDIEVAYGGNGIEARAVKPVA
jgi:2-polyprenyl-3-methyl-5-hydroxy-6-metoxy-1,4-benzoquinol methylase